MTFSIGELVALLSLIATIVGSVSYQSHWITKELKDRPTWDDVEDHFVSRKECELHRLKLQHTQNKKKGAYEENDK